MDRKPSFDFEEQFKKLYLPLNLFALRIVEDSDEAEDIVQQCFVDVWELICGGQEIDSFKSYMYMVVRNRCLSFKNGATFQNVGIDECCDSISDTSEDEAVVLSERDARLWRVIDQLPQERRRIFLMSKRDGMKYSEIASALGLSVKTVENQMGKALKSLREMAHKIYIFFLG